MSKGTSLLKSSMTIQGDVSQGQPLAAAAQMLPVQGNGLATEEATEGNSSLGTQCALTQLFCNLWLKVLASTAESLRSLHFIYFYL